MHVTILQRIFPHYRYDVFAGLADRLEGNFTLIHGQTLRTEGIHEAPENCPFNRIRIRNRYLAVGQEYVCWQPGIIDTVVKTAPSVFVTETNIRIRSTPALISAVQERKVATVGWGLGKLNNEPTGILGRWFWQQSQRQTESFDVLIAYSSKGAEDYVKLGARPENVFVAPNAVKGRRGEDGRMGGEGQRKMGGGENERMRGGASVPTVLSLGRLLDSKRVDDLIVACAESESQPELIVAGDGPDMDRLRKIASDRYPKTSFTGHITGERLDQVLGSVDLFVLPGLGGLAIQQAVSSGLPVIVASGDGTQADLVDDGVNGYLIREGDIEALAGRIDELCASRELRLSMGMKSKEIASKVVNLDAMLDSMMAAFDTSIRVANEH